MLFTNKTHKEEARRNDLEAAFPGATKHGEIRRPLYHEFPDLPLCNKRQEAFVRDHYAIRRAIPTKAVFAF